SAALRARLFPYTTLFRSSSRARAQICSLTIPEWADLCLKHAPAVVARLNSQVLLGDFGVSPQSVREVVEMIVDLLFWPIVAVLLWALVVASPVGGVATIAASVAVLIAAGGKEKAKR